MNPFRWSFRAQCMLGFVACAALIGYALYVQFQLRILPCPFCIFQRIAFAATGIVFLVAGLMAPRTPGARRGWSMLAFVCAAIGAGIAGRHYWVQLNPPELPVCGSGLNYMLQSMGWLDSVRQVLTASGDCSNVDWTFLGLTMPAWALVWFVALALWALYVGWRRRRAGMFGAAR